MEPRTMCHAASVLVVALDDAGIPFSLGNAAYVYFIAFCEHICLDFLANFIRSCILQLELAQVTQ